MEILSHTVTSSEPSNGFPPVNTHAGTAKFQIQEILDASPTWISFLCLTMNYMVAEKLSVIVLDMPAYSPATLLNSIFRQLNLTTPNVHRGCALDDVLTQEHKDYFGEHNLLTKYHTVVRVKLLQHMQSLGHTELMFDFFFESTQ